MRTLSHTTVKHIAWCLFALAVVFLARGLYIPAKAALAQRLLASAWEETLSNEHPNKPWPWSDTYPVARLCAPTHGINQIVLAGDRGNSLAFGPGLHPDSDLEKTSGVVLISGHRDTQFNFLKYLKRGEPLTLQTQDRRLTHYRVQDIQVVNGKQAIIQQPDNNQWLVLVTCYPFNSINANPSLRYVVIAKAIHQMI